MDLLHAVREHGSISAAAKALGLSYRHVWGELKRWEAELGHTLIVWDKGQPARLSEFGDKLLWAERQAQARLAPQIEALHADLERAFAVAFDDTAQVLTLFASHDDALAALREHAVAAARLHLDIRFCGSVDAIGALNEGRCVMAGFHAPRLPGGGALARRAYEPLLQPGRHKLIGFARRTQGLIVAAGNPLRLQSLADLAQRRARFVNRAHGTGTRVLLDELLGQAGLAPTAIEGYETNEPSHAAVAQAVASGAADAGLGIEAAARSRGLDFVPLLQEDYYLVCLKAALEQPAVLALREVLRSAAWQQQLAALPGYAPEHCGEVLSLRARLPWWDFRAQEAHVGEGVAHAGLLDAEDAEERRRRKRKTKKDLSFDSLNSFASSAYFCVFCVLVPDPIPTPSRSETPRNRRRAPAARSRGTSGASCASAPRTTRRAARARGRNAGQPRSRCASVHASAAKPGQGRSVLAVHSRTSPQRRPRRAAVCAAISHSTSVGSRRPAQRAQASASHQLTCITLWLPDMRAALPKCVCITAPLATPICSTYRGPRRPSARASRSSHSQPCGSQNSGRS